MNKLSFPSWKKSRVYFFLQLQSNPPGFLFFYICFDCTSTNQGEISFCFHLFFSYPTFIHITLGSVKLFFVIFPSRIHSKLGAFTTRSVSEYYKFCRASKRNSAHFSNFSMFVHQDEVISHVTMHRKRNTNTAQNILNLELLY